MPGVAPEFKLEIVGLNIDYMIQAVEYERGFLGRLMQDAEKPDPNLVKRIPNHQQILKMVAYKRKKQRDLAKE